METLMKVTSNWLFPGPQLGAYEPWYDLKCLKSMELEGNYQKPMIWSCISYQMLKNHRS